MGNTIATICYDSVKHNKFNDIIVELRTCYNLTEARPEYLKCMPGKRCEGAQVVTIFSWDGGGEVVLEKYAEDVVDALKKAGATGVTSTIRFQSFGTSR